MDFSKKHRAILEKALHFYGIDKQLDIAVEKNVRIDKSNNQTPPLCHP